MAEQVSSKTLTPNAALTKLLLHSLIMFLFISALVFISAGRMNWPLGWVFVVMWGLPKLVFILLLRMRDPALLVERMTRHENTQSYERLLVPAYMLLAYATILVAALDGGRFRWSGDISIGLIIAGYVINLSMSILAAWAVDANSYFSAESRLQTDRAQIVTQSGPYRFVRHPGYLSAVVLWPFAGLMLESWWAAIPGCLAGLMMLIRTVLEDRMLQSQLPGYAEYARQVRYRLFPGVW
ncbi:MAG: isoprenylcysteine carboxylmethyltransferase family protein [Anaerolineaceae bacterium]|nr:isoprenylcysteine carboxylmethyltransferase family protein [Anaerolineaceae bacterium]